MDWVVSFVNREGEELAYGEPPFTRGMDIHEVIYEAMDDMGLSPSEIEMIVVERRD